MSRSGPLEAFFIQAGVRCRAASGSGLVVVLVATLVLSAMALALVLLSMTETLTASNGRRATTALYAAHAGIERVLADLSRLPDWNPVLDGSVSSGFVDGQPSGARLLADGREIRLEEVVNLANCGTTVSCTPSEMDRVTAERPWGRNNPRWRLLAHGGVRDLAPLDGLDPEEYLVVLVADDPAENDQDPARDGRAGNPGEGLLLLRAEALGVGATHRAVEATVARGLPGTGEAGYTGQRGQGSTAIGGVAATIQLPGGAVTRLEMAAAGGMTRQ